MSQLKELCSSASKRTLMKILSDTSADPRVRHVGDVTRTLCATDKACKTIFVRRHQEGDHTPSYEVYGYTGDLASSPEACTFPPEAPEAFESEREATQWAASYLGVSPATFTDVRQGCSVEIDLPTALRTLEMGPLRVGMRAEAVIECLGIPESATRLSEGSVCWLYGAVQVHLRDRQLAWIEIDNGASDFTSLWFTNWLFQADSTPASVTAALDSLRVRYRRRLLFDAPAIELGDAGGPRFLVDFHADTSQIHGFYWGELLDLVGA